LDDFPPAKAPCGPAGPLIEYPQDYVFKAIGLTSDDFAEHLRVLVAGAGLFAPAERVSVRESSGGKYQSVSLWMRLGSEAERQAVYRALRGDGRVVYCL